MTITAVLEQTDWALLASQKAVLVETIEHLRLAVQVHTSGHQPVAAARTQEQVDALDGVLNWLDNVQDAAAGEGHPVVFLMDPPEPASDPAAPPSAEALSAYRPLVEAALHDTCGWSGPLTDEQLRPHLARGHTAERAAQLIFAEQMDGNAGVTVYAQDAVPAPAPTVRAMDDQEELEWQEGEWSSSDATVTPLGPVPGGAH